MSTHEARSAAREQTTAHPRTPPVKCRWTGEHFAPVGTRAKRKAREHFQVGEIYALAVPDRVQRMAGRMCTAGGCRRAHFSKGYCRLHYDRWLRHGDPHKLLVPMPERGSRQAWLRDHVSWQSDECLTWPFARHPSGRSTLGDKKPSRIMCELAHGPAPSPLHVAAHSCGKGHEACVSPRHLRWATPAENVDDMRRHGTMCRGEAIAWSKLTEADVLAIKQLEGHARLSDVARRFDISPPHVKKIWSGLIWRHVSL